MTRIIVKVEIQTPTGEIEYVGEASHTFNNDQEDILKLLREAASTALRDFKPVVEKATKELNIRP